MKSSIYIDISLLGILFALHFTHNPKTQNFKLGVLFLLFSHVIITSSNCNNNDVELETLGTAEKEVPLKKEKIEIPNEITNVITEENIPVTRKNVSDSKFDRNFSVPENSMVLSNPNPIVSDDTNQRLANARTNFWAGLVN